MLSDPRELLKTMFDAAVDAASPKLAFLGISLRHPKVVRL